jgi:multidrug resistance efflux pump
MANWGKVVKHTISIGLIVGGVGYFVQTRYRLIASYAVVVGPLVTVRSPMDGVLAHDVRNFSVLESRSKLGSVTAVPANDPELRAATADLQTIRAEVASLKDLIDLGKSMRENVSGRQSTLGSRRTIHLDRQILQAKAELAARKAAMEGALQAQRRSSDLCAKGLMQAQECDSLFTKAEIAKREFELADRQADTAQFLARASRAGADIGQNIGSEIAYARQMNDDLTLRLASLEQQRTTQEARVSALELRVSPPPVELATSDDVRVWSVYHQNGELVSKGEPLFDLVSCTKMFVFATVTEERYQSIHVGTDARVKIGNQAYRGRVVQLLGPYGSFSQERTMQPQPPVILNKMDATSSAVAVEVSGLPASLKSCQVGLVAKVEFSRG